jgi:DNA-binding SARP family transcriptional activator
MEFRILGPLEVVADGRPLNLGGLGQQRLLAALLLSANRSMSVARLAEAVWDDAPPPNARRQLQNRVATLRAVLARGGAANAIITTPVGYLLRIDPDQLDAARFDAAVARARSTADAATAIRLLRDALATWRGPAIAGIGGPALERAAAALDERRLTAVEDCLGLELAAGRHSQLVAELTRLVGEHPTRERLVGHLMLALWHSGRQADALAAYHRFVRLLAGELKLEPGPVIRRLHEAILRGEQDRPVPAGRPAQLPPGIVPFTGHEDALCQLDKLLSNHHGGTAVVIAALTGPSGSGKTALAVHWAHRVRDRFPDGQLHVDLGGCGPGPIGPHDALAHFLRALGVPADDVPTDVEAAAATYRSLLADRRMLVLLDNAVAADQVRPLLPGSPGCLVVVTSRDRLAGLVATNGAHRIALDAPST